MAVGCGGSRDERSVRLGIGAQQSPTQMLAYLADGLFHFEAEGLKVTLEEFPGSSKGLEALLGGSIDVLSGYHEQTLQLGKDAPKVRSFLVMMRSHMVVLAVAPSASDRIGSMGELKGATVGVTSLGSATQLLLNHLLVKAGMKPEDVRPVAISTGARALAAMERGVVEAGVISDYTLRHLNKRFGRVKVLADTRTEDLQRLVYGSPSYPSTVLMAKQEWLEANPEKARRLVKAIGRTRQWVMSRTAEDVAARLPASHRGEDLKLHEEVIRATMAMLHPDGRMSEEEALAARRAAGKKTGTDETYTNRFVAEP